MKTKNLVLCGVFAAITAILAPISVPIGPIPITLGVLAVLLCAGLLPPRLAVVSQLIYLLLGAIGLPVFSGFTGGFSKFAGPTGGYLAVYPVMALAVSCLLELSDKKFRCSAVWRAVWTVLVLAAGTAICHTGGALWYSFSARITLGQAFSVASLPFLPAELIKIAAAAVLILALRRRIRPMAQ